MALLGQDFRIFVSSALNDRGAPAGSPGRTGLPEASGMVGTAVAHLVEIDPH
jgi:hypothetical protein